jgi:hypothetical protein
VKFTRSSRIVREVFRVCGSLGTRTHTKYVHRNDLNDDGHTRRYRILDTSFSARDSVRELRHGDRAVPGSEDSTGLGVVKFRI